MSSILSKIYLDYASTTPLDPEAKKAMEPYLEEKFGNPSSTHSLGQEARVAIDKSREKVADFLGCNFAEIYFTSGATESNNLAIKGVAVKASMFLHNCAKTLTQREKLKNERNEGGETHIITSKIEHKSVLKPIESLEKSGSVDAAYLPIDKNGVADISNLKNEIKENTALISVMYVNNETGVIQPVKEISAIIKEWKSRNKSKFGIQYPLFHIDAVQAAGHLSLNVRELGCDLLSISSHKIYGPKGIGALYVKDGTPIAPLIEGGGQELGLRAGTENVASIVGFGRAVELIKPPISNFQFLISNKIPNLRDYFEENLLKKIKNISINGGGAPRAPHISNILFRGVEAETLLIALDDTGIMVSSGSACQAKAIEPSHVLLAMGLSKKDVMSSVRFSFGKFTPTPESFVCKGKDEWQKNAKRNSKNHACKSMVWGFTTKEEIDRVLEILPEMVEKLRK